MGPLEWAVAGRAFPGEDVSGDDWLAVDAAGRALVGAIDGLGHGASAASAAQLAKQNAIENRDKPLDVVFALSHAALEGSRGAAMTLARIDMASGALEWVGVGNVAAFLVRIGTMGASPAEAALLRGGVLGLNPPKPLRVRKTVMVPGDLLLVGTDGLAAGFEDGADLSLPTGQVVTAILERSAGDADDALVLAVRNRAPSR
jgi:phosphoserine phosphatase RsbX